MEVQERIVIQTNIKEDNRNIISEVDNVLRNNNLEVFMSKSQNIRRRADRWRCSLTPGSVTDVKKLASIPEEYSLIEGKPFLRLNLETDRGRIIIFSSEEGLEILGQSTEWHGDGTFATSTKLFYQIYPIFASIEGSKHLVPCVFCLLPDKSAETYEVKTTLWGTMPVFLGNKTMGGGGVDHSPKCAA